MSPSEETVGLAAKTLRIVTDHRSVAEFIHQFCRRVDERHMVVTLARPQARGARIRFSVQLAGGEPVFQGTGQIVAVREHGSGAGMAATIALDELDHESRTMHRCLLIATRGTDRRPSGDLLAKPTSVRRPRIPTPRSFPRASLPLPPPPVEPEKLSAAEMAVPENPLGDVPSGALEQFIESAMTDPSPVGRPPTVVPPAPPLPAPPVLAAAPTLRPVPPPLVEPPRERPLVPARIAKLVPRTLLSLAILVALLLFLAYRL
jgi:hypothetical protein